MKSNLLRLFGLAMLAVILQGCSHPKPGFWVNDKIDPDKRAKLHELNNLVFKDIKARDDKHIRSFLSKELLDAKSLNREVELIGNYLKKDDYELYNEYYVVNKWHDQDTIKLPVTGINSYSLYYKGLEKEMYIAFYLPKTGNAKKMITVIYCNYSYGWKVAKFGLAFYTINNKTAPELYNLAKEELSKGYLSDAVTTIDLAKSCLVPSEVWKYPQEDQIGAFSNSLVVMANNKFKEPFIINVPTHPRIFRVFNEKTPDEYYYPEIYYLSSIKLKDTIAIRKEYMAVKKEIGKTIPGIDKDKKFLFFGVFNERPTFKKPVDHFDITDKLQ